MVVRLVLFPPRCVDLGTARKDGLSALSLLQLHLSQEVSCTSQYYTHAREFTPLSPPQCIRCPWSLWAIIERMGAASGHLSRFHGNVGPSIGDVTAEWEPVDQ